MRLKLGMTFKKRRRSAAPSAVIQLSAATVNDTAAIGTVVGILTVTGGIGTYTYTLTDAGLGNKFALFDLGDGTAELRVAAALSAGSISVSVSATNGTTPTSRSFSISIADTTAPTITSSSAISVAENALLAHALTANEAIASWTIIGGVDAARFEISGSTLRWLGNGTKDFELPDDTGANNVYDVQVRATDGSGNGANQNIAVTVTNVAEGGEFVLDPSLPTPTLALAVAGNVYPPQFSASFPGGMYPGDEIELVHATSYSGLIAMTSGAIGNDDDDNGVVDFSLAAIASGSTFSRCRLRVPSLSIYGPWSDISKHGDIVAPTMTSTNPSSAAENQLVLCTLTFDELVYAPVLGGSADAALLAISGSAPATSYDVVLATGLNLNFEAKASYAYTVNATDLAGNALATVNMVSNVTDQVENPTGLSGFFTDQTGTTTSTLYLSANTFTVSGLTASSVPISIAGGGEYSKNGGAYTSAPGTVVNGDTIRLRATTGANPGDLTSVTVTMGGVSDTWTLQNTGGFDPATLFGVGDNGWYFDPSDLSTLWSDTAGTVPATVNGPVKRITDKSGKGNDHIWQSGNTLTLRQIGSFYYLEAPTSNGVTSNTSINLTNPMERITGIRQISWTAFGRIFASTSGDMSLRQASGGSSPQLQINNGSNVGPVSPALNTDHVISEVFNDPTSSIQLDNGTPLTGTVGAAGSTGHVLFNRGSGANGVNGYFWGGVNIIGRTLTAGERAAMRTWIAAKYGGTL